MTEIVGHELLDEPVDGWGRPTTSPLVARAMCECGQMSGIAPSDALRREWHAAHLEEVQA